MLSPLSPVFPPRLPSPDPPRSCWIDAKRSWRGLFFGFYSQLWFAIIVMFVVLVRIVSLAKRNLPGARSEPPLSPVRAGTGRDGRCVGRALRVTLSGRVAGSSLRRFVWFPLLLVLSWLAPTVNRVLK